LTAALAVAAAAAAAAVAAPGDRKSGGCRVLYDPTYSQLGALKCVGRAPRKPSPFDVSLPLIIKTPHALPMFREEPGRKRQREKDRQVGAAGWGGACVG
jgi:hypothetical protein